MKVSRRVATSLATALCLLAATAATSQPEAAAPAAKAPPAATKAWYVDVGAGLNWLDQESGHPHPADTGLRLSAAVGRNLGSRWAMEIETGYLSNSLPETKDHEANNITQVPLLLNVFYIVPTQSPLKPFLGAGLGAMFVSDENDSGGDAGVHFMGGLRYTLDDGKSLGISYRFIMFGVISAVISEPVGNDSILLDLKLAI